MKGAAVSRLKVQIQQTEGPDTEAGLQTTGNQGATGSEGEADRLCCRLSMNQSAGIHSLLLYLCVKLNTER